MQAFLGSVIEKLLDTHKDDLANLCIVLPSRRASLFFKTELARQLKSTVWLPRLFSIEDFITDLTGLQVMDDTRLLFEFYEIYRQIEEAEADSFEAFVKWAPLLLSDFNEIDRYLVDASHLFSYLSDAKKLEQWGLKHEKEASPFVLSYLRFWESIGTYYEAFAARLRKQKVVWQGLAYREAAENFEALFERWEHQHEVRKMVFVGFNALNKAEEQMVKILTKNKKAEVFCDADAWYLENDTHEAGFFFRAYLKKGLYSIRDFYWKYRYLQEAEREIHSIGVSGRVGQAQLTGAILAGLQSPGAGPEHTAVVLADETVLVPTLNALPQSIEKLNITMGFPLRNTPPANLFEDLLLLHQNAANRSQNSENPTTCKFYHKDLIRVFEHPWLKNALSGPQGFPHADKVIEEMRNRNSVFMRPEDLRALLGEVLGGKAAIQFLFSDWKNHAGEALAYILRLIELLKDRLVKNEKQQQASIELEYLFHFARLFHVIKSLLDQYSFVSDIKTLHILFKQLLQSEKLAFYGEPLSGLQVMGMLETRALDFENLIITSVNEGFLPAGKSVNSLIPFDIRKEVGLPTYQEKDALYAYHFYRLLQRAKKVYLIHNTQTDSFGSGEQSRFVTQLEHELAAPHSQTRFYKNLWTVPPQAIENPAGTSVEKTPAVMERLQEMAAKGFSPSSLISYINNPLEFYYQKVLYLDEQEEVEEIIGADTLGKVVHRTLEVLYTPFIGKVLSEDALGSMAKDVEKVLVESFEEEYENGRLDTGKNVLIFAVAKRFVNNFLQKEQEQLKQLKELKILGLEELLEATVMSELFDFPIHLKGIADRIDLADGELRIIDYKTGFVNQKDLNVNDMEELTHSLERNKAFQLLMYAWMYTQKYPDIALVKSGIIAFRSLHNWLMPVRAGEAKTTAIGKTEQAAFETVLIHLLSELMNPGLPFEERKER